MTNLDPNDFEIVPHVAVVDEFRMSDSSGGMVTLVDAKFLSLTCARMNEREIQTGDLSPLVIGHTGEDTPEHDQPQIVGYARNWVVDPFFETGRQASFADFWIYKTRKLILSGNEVVLSAREIANRWPRRSAEVWTDRHEVDPISLLGATTPARDLGLLKLSRNGSFTYVSPGETKMNPQSPDVNAAAQGLSAPNEKLQSSIDQLTALVQKLVDSQAPPVDPAAAGAPPGAPPAPGAPAGAPDAGMSDDELMQLLGGQSGQGEPQGAPAPADDGASRAGQEPVKNAGGYPGGTNTAVPNLQPERLSALEQELSATRLQLNRLQLSAQLSKLRTEGYDIDPEDQELISDLAAQPNDMRARSLTRITKLARKAPVKDSFGFESALNASTTGNARRMSTPDEVAKVIKLARDKNLKFEDAAVELGYTV